MASSVSAGGLASASAAEDDEGVRGGLGSMGLDEAPQLVKIPLPAPPQQERGRAAKGCTVAAAIANRVYAE